MIFQATHEAGLNTQERTRTPESGACEPVEMLRCENARTSVWHFWTRASTSRSLQ